MSESAVRSLYSNLLIAWNQRDAAAMAALYTQDGSQVGFDGSQVNGSKEIEAHLAPIFADHPTAAYVGIVRELRFLSADVALLRAVAGMVPPGGDDINPAANSIQSLVAVHVGDEWKAALFHNTPAAWHRREADRQQLTAELRQAYRQSDAA